MEEKTIFECPIEGCNFSTTCKIQILFHGLQEHEARRVEMPKLFDIIGDNECPVCGKIIGKGGKKRHLIECASANYDCDSVLVCPSYNCDYTTKHKRMIVVHGYSFHRQELFNAPEKFYAISNISSLRDCLPAKCYICGAEFSAHRSMRRHVNGSACVKTRRTLFYNIR